jgi:hypothetical protein
VTQAAWDWVTETYEAIRLIFIRHAAPERIIAEFGADPSRAVTVPANVTDEAAGFPWLRTGRTGEWAFSMDTCLSSSFESERLARVLSAGTDLALFELFPGKSYFYYHADGQEVTSFEPVMSPWRHGSDPDRFVRQMRQAGLDVDPPSEDAELGGNPALALLNTLTLALGIRLPGEQALGPLPTVGVTEPLSGS